MNKITAIMSAVALCVGLLTGCGQSYDVSDSTVFIRKDGKVVSTDVESFDVNTYDENGLKAYIEDAISAYTAVYGEEGVVLKDLSVKEGKAKLVMEYASASDYAAFNGIELYTGNIASAMAEGYSFDVEFASVKDGNASACLASDFIGGDYKAAIIKDNVNVHVDGTVLYVSAVNTRWVDKSTIEIRDGIHLLGNVTEPESVEPEESEGKPEEDESGESEEDMPAIDEDLLDVTEKDTEVVFEFDEEPEQEKDDDNTEFSTVYTYIIYK